ncbi:flagellar hook-length control protein FliK [Ammonifex thiophilus]|uniref:Flagellar hook-length control protein FliK n=1 Tax=Ammonifex thiophilus TaxID=444093 RepID=A0A3D8P5T1_9THEO|nr:flagellar hook-length control protein FliK [Ammonifex thiophilus]RDV84676.1 flagellar hook-length control protein FliK [Ammonifex thiophilus]
MATPPVASGVFPGSGLAFPLPAGGKGEEDFASLLSLLMALFLSGWPAVNPQPEGAVPGGGSSSIPGKEAGAEPTPSLSNATLPESPAEPLGEGRPGPYIPGSSLKGVLQNFWMRQNYLPEKPPVNTLGFSASQFPAPDRPLPPEAATAPVLQLLDSQTAPLKSDSPAPFSWPGLQPEETCAAPPASPSPVAEGEKGTQDLPGAVKEVGRAEERLSSFAELPTLSGEVGKMVSDKPCGLHQLPQRLTQEIVAHVTSWRREGETLRLELKLEPPELGRIVAHLTFAEGNLKLRFWAPEAEIKEIILHTLPELQQQLTRVGVELGEVAVLVGTGGGDLPREGSEPRPRAFPSGSVARREKEQDKGLSYWA